MDYQIIASIERIKQCTFVTSRLFSRWLSLCIITVISSFFYGNVTVFMLLQIHFFALLNAEKQF